MTDTTTENVSLRDVIEENFDNSVETTSSEAPAEAPVEAQTEGYEAPQSEQTETPEEKAQREYTRDQKGKFATPEEAAKVGEKGGKQEGIKPGPKPGYKEKPDPTERAPQAWKPEAREFWKDIPQAARQEIVRHEQQVKEALMETAEKRKYADAVSKVIEPYRHLIRAEGSNDLQAIDNMMAVAARLRTGTSQELAEMVGRIVTTYGTGRFGNEFINRLDNVLSGNVAPPENPEIAAMRQRMEQEMAPFRQWQQQMSQQQVQEQQRINYEADRAVEQFYEKAEFINEVDGYMAHLMDAAAAQNQYLPMEQAYEIACRAHPEVSKILQSREQAKIAQNMNSNAARAKSAAVSVGGSPSLGGNSGAPAQGSIRDHIEFAMSRNTR